MSTKSPKAWTELYRSPGDALNALLSWRSSIPKADRPLGYGIGQVPGVPDRFMIYPIQPSVILEVFEDAFEETQTLGVSMRAVLSDALDSSPLTEERAA